VSASSPRALQCTFWFSASSSPYNLQDLMTWIRTIPLPEADEKLRRAIDAQKALYPKEYESPVHPTADGTSGIVASHSLIPDALYHAFATFGALMAPDLPLTRRQHEMITTVVSVTNRCRY
jgi:alkylhydroperoxidase family enzyme